MEPRVRLSWSKGPLRPWCPGASLPPRPSPGGPPAATGFLRVQGLLERLRQRRAGARAVPVPQAAQAPIPQAVQAAGPEPLAPLPKAHSPQADAARAETEASAREASR